jgi:hypothetical protein
MDLHWCPVYDLMDLLWLPNHYSGYYVLSPCYLLSYSCLHLPTWGALRLVGTLGRYFRMFELDSLEISVDLRSKAMNGHYYLP